MVEIPVFQISKGVRSLKGYNWDPSWIVIILFDRLFNTNILKTFDVGVCK